MSNNILRQFALTVICLLGVGSAVAWSQNIHVKGVVLDENGAGMMGAGIIQKGTEGSTTNGTISDLDGNFQITVPQGSILVIQALGYVSQEVPASEYMRVQLETDSEMLNETVVVGYGVQKKSVVTAAISSITSDDLKAQSQNRLDNMLQGMASGVLVTQSSGSPSAGSQVRVRGVGTIHNSDPLYIVDGMPAGSIDYLNPNDIERIEILKDAASGAVYGARAANGVILVTTKKGKEGKVHVNYDFSYGMQNPWRKPAVLNATEYAVMMNEGMLNDGQTPIYADPYSLGEGTDWVDAIFDKNSPIVKHDVNIMGGSEKSDYSISGGYLSNKGTIGGRFDRSYYNRFTLRENIGVTLFDESASRNWLNKMTFRNQVSYAHIRSQGISTNSEFGAPLGSAMGMSPLEAIYATAEDELRYQSLYPAGYPYIIRNKDGVAYSIADAGVYNEQPNPIAMLDRPAGHSSTDKLVAGLTTELQLIDGLRFRNSVTMDLAYVYSHSYSPEYFLTSKDFKYDTVTSSTTYDKNGNATVTDKINYGSSATQSMNRYYTWQVENVFTYDKTLGRHAFNVVLGQSALRSISANVGASANGLTFPYDEWKISVNNTLGQRENGDRNGWGSWNSIPYSLLSYFGRISYNYDERYMFEATVRRDASSRFGKNNKWGTFPSFSVGWNIKNEAFMKDIFWLSTAKLRASWGVNGNDNIGDFTYAVYTSSNNNYVFGSGGNGSEAVNIGVKPSGLANPNVKWEESKQTDIGLDLGFWGNRLTATVDFYNKNTTGMLLSMPVPAYAGDSAPTGNLGDMVNRGLEIDLGYRNHIDDFNYGIKFNASYNKNKLTYLGDDATYLSGSSHKLGTLTRGVVGLPFPYFYGWKTDGVFQNWEEVNSYVNEEGALLQPNAQPGDFRFVDTDENGVINDDDRTMIGKGIPDWTFGLTLNFDWKGFDFSMLLQGQLGAQAYNVSRRTDLYYINLPKNILFRWTGEGSTNEYPRFAFNSANENYRASDYWVEDASFLRARNVQLGYTLPHSLTRIVAIQRLRLYVQAENLFTLTRYTGCDPEVTGGNSGYGTEVGIDRGVYPQNRTFTFGVNVNF
ncbi:MAG: TonB-dependent receptor [Bacteroidales bacterium]|nr:TonB-dependent receptor [Bacteroidales bacterium]